MNRRTVDIPFAAYLLFAALWLGWQMFQGFSFLDIGMYMMGYRHFISDPYASSYLGQWIMTYDVTGHLCQLFGVSTFMGLRVMHLLLVLLTQIIVYAFLRRYIDKRYIILGLFIATLAHYGSYTEITYNDYSAFLLMLSLISFQRGVERDRWWLVGVAGMMAGVAVFFRVVNLTYVGIPILSCLINLRWNIGMRPMKRIVAFYCGMLVGGALVVGMLYAEGLLPVLQLTVADITHISADKGDSHGMLVVMRSIYKLYTEVLGNMCAILLFASMVYFALGRKRVREKGVLLGAGVVLMLFVMNFSFFSPNITIALCVAGALALFFVKRESVEADLAHLVLMSMYLPLIMPVGSNAEPSFYGKELCFLTLPLTVFVLMKMMPEKCSLINKHDAVSERFCRTERFVLATLCFGFVFFNLAHKQMEDGNRKDCRYTINSKLTKGIFTTKDNAEMYNYLLQRVKPLVPSGSYMICNFSLPAVPVLDCRPWAVYSTVYSTDSMNDRYIQVAWQHTGKLPYVLLDCECDLLGYDHILQRLNEIKPYRKVWTDGRYELYKDIAAAAK